MGKCSLGIPSVDNRHRSRTQKLSALGISADIPRPSGRIDRDGRELGNASSSSGRNDAPTVRHSAVLAPRTERPSDQLVDSAVAVQAYQDDMFFAFCSQPLINI